jgi:hypothetical protein
MGLRKTSGSRFAKEQREQWPATEDGALNASRLERSEKTDKMQVADRLRRSPFELLTQAVSFHSAPKQVLSQVKLGKEGAGGAFKARGRDYGATRVLLLALLPECARVGDVFRWCRCAQRTGYRL